MIPVLLLIMLFQDIQDRHVHLRRTAAAHSGAAVQVRGSHGERHELCQVRSVIALVDYLSHLHVSKCTVPSISSGWGSFDWEYRQNAAAVLAAANASSAASATLPSASASASATGAGNITVASPRGAYLAAASGDAGDDFGSMVRPS